MLFPPIHDAVVVKVPVVTCACGRDLAGLLGCPDCLAKVVVPDGVLAPPLWDEMRNAG